MKKNMRKMFALALVVCLMVGLFAFPHADDRPEVLPEVEEFYVKWSLCGSLTWIQEDWTLDMVYERYGERVGNQCANTMNYFWDTLDPTALKMSMQFIDPEDAEWFGVGYPDDWGQPNYPADFLRGYTPVSPHPDRSWAGHPDSCPCDADRGYKLLKGLQAKLTDVTDAVASISDVQPSPAPISSSVITDGPFPDVSPDAWYFEAVNAMKSSGIIQGCEDGLFHPEKLVTQGEFYTMILRAGSYPGANLNGGHEPGIHWATTIIKNASRLGYNPDCETGHENNPVDRAEAVTRVVHLNVSGSSINSDTPEARAYSALWAEITGITIPRGVGVPVNFVSDMSLTSIPDYKEIEGYLKVARFGTRESEILYAYKTGICKGVDANGTFNPYGLLTRAEVAQLFYNAKLTTRIHCLPDIVRGTGAYDFTSTENVIY